MYFSYIRRCRAVLLLFLYQTMPRCIVAVLIWTAAMLMASGLEVRTKFPEHLSFVVFNYYIGT
jgi:hypothetical protein